jgi:A/G-specific adenine glycosylase
MPKRAAAGTNAILSPAWRRALAARLLTWFGGAARDLPWRRTSDLYAIWISEIMLQQTQVATVIAYYQRFLDRFPDVHSLAAADEQDVLRLWEGLGYYRRARQLHAAARQIVAEHDGKFPAHFATVRALPGIGRYTAGAILSIGADARLPILEANTIRVLSRLTAFRGDPATTAGQKHLWTIAEAILPAKQVGAFNQSLMELGSEICTPKSPNCADCPVAGLCEARRLGLVAQIPHLAKRTNYEDLTEAAVVIRRGQRVLIRQCQPGERWAGLWDFPRFAIATTDAADVGSEVARATLEQVGLRIDPPQRLATLKHGVTRFRITLHCFEARPQSPQRNGKPSAGGPSLRWVAIEELTGYPLSVTGRKISRLLAEGATRQTPRASAARRRRSRHNAG